jgi:hypothetical protein
MRLVNTQVLADNTDAPFQHLEIPPYSAGPAALLPHYVDQAPDQDREPNQAQDAGQAALSARNLDQGPDQDQKPNQAQDAGWGTLSAPNQDPNQAQGVDRGVAQGALGGKGRSTTTAVPPAGQALPEEDAQERGGKMVVGTGSRSGCDEARTAPEHPYWDTIQELIRNPLKAHGSWYESQWLHRHLRFYTFSFWI